MKCFDLVSQIFFAIASRVKNRERQSRNSSSFLFKHYINTHLSILGIMAARPDKSAE
jgi:hypothetical protein